MKFRERTKALDIAEVHVSDGFWKDRMELARTKVVPYEWEALNDRIEGAATSHAMENFRIAGELTSKKAAGDAIKENEKFNGFVFQDSDAAKWLEAVAFILMWKKDEQMEKTADEAIDIICAAQQPDGYLDTYYIINGLEKRWTNLRENHELYCLGHLLEAAVAYYQATGKRKLLDAMIRYVDYVDTKFGIEPEKLKGYPGHEVIEMALIRLYEVTNNEKHLKLAQYFINERGNEPNYFEIESKKYNQDFWWKDTYFKLGYYQAHKPVREQKAAIGHAVRAVYLYSGMADVAKYSEDDSLLEACELLWDNITKRQMYITGSIGASSTGEAFSFDYDLPNGTAYAETCAAIGLVFFAKRMLELSPDSKYADGMEKALYNGVISGISLDGNKFFYVNPLEVVPEYCLKDEKRRHVKVERQKWFGCACCPPNIARLMASIGNYIYTAKEDMIYTHLYIGSKFTKLLSGEAVTVEMKTSYPWDEDVHIEFTMERNVEFGYSLRIPEWCNNYTLQINGQKIEAEIKNGYAVIQREWSNKDSILLHMEMPVEIMQSNPRVRENFGKVAVMRGPIVYCLEEEDNGAELHRISIGGQADFHSSFEKDLLGGVVAITSNGKKYGADCWDADSLYQPIEPNKIQEKTLKWIPYYAWANRRPGEMRVWINRD